MLVQRLIQSLDIPLPLLAHIVGVSSEEIEKWSASGVPSRYLYDFTLLDSIVGEMRSRGMEPRDAMRMEDEMGRTLLQLLVEEGPGARSFWNAWEGVREEHPVAGPESRGIEKSRETLVKHFRRMLPEDVERAEPTDIPVLPSKKEVRRRIR